ncbi:MAG: malto-oligosyltrehalose trehalohydrolase [Pseudomonadota bacterium]
MTRGRAHAMPFGAQLRDDGTARFRLWAPSARTVDLVLTRGEATRSLAMSRQDAGWHEGIHPATAGDRYRYRIDDGIEVPDPASRFNPDDVHGASALVDPAAYAWGDDAWHGRPWEETVIYELHVGTFSPEGTFAGAQARLDYLAELGVTALELMPVADFPGRRNWGYDGVLPFAPDAAYGTPDDLKRLVDAAHARALMVFMDVVYNHFGPEGNYLHAYAKPFFTERHPTPWGAAINFDGAGSRAVRDFVIHNALYWLNEYHADGLRLDAVHAIADDSAPDILEELAATVRAGPGRERHVHLVLENDKNQARYLGPDRYDAQWNDDIHHAFHILLTGEDDGYYADYAARPAWYLGRCLAEGFAYQGDVSEYRDGKLRGEPSAHLPPTAFVSFVQTHDQVGNRAFGERLSALTSEDQLRPALAAWLLAPAVPLLFMGEEFAAASPFLFFCDFGPELAQAVTQGRRREFARFERFSNPAAQARIPDPNAPATFEASKLDWASLARAPHARFLELYRELLALRRAEIAPRLAGARSGTFELLHERALRVRWPLGDGSRLVLHANLGDAGAAAAPPGGRRLFALPPAAGEALGNGRLPPWSCVWHLETSPAA